MAEETIEERLARLEAENSGLREAMERERTTQLRLKVSQKGALSVYGLGRFPVHPGERCGAQGQGLEKPVSLSNPSPSWHNVSIRNPGRSEPAAILFSGSSGAVDGPETFSAEKGSGPLSDVLRYG